LSTGTRLPAGHPSLESTICRYDLIGSLRNRFGCVLNITTYHGNIDQLLTKPFSLPSDHPAIPPMFSKVMTAIPWHTNLTYIIANKKQYPAGHPNITSLLCKYDLLASLGKGCVSNVSTFHGNLNLLLNKTFSLPSYHPSIPNMFRSVLPWWHRNLR
jgi:hypothetical protein